MFGRHVGDGADGGAGAGEIEAGGVGYGLRVAAGGAGGARDFGQTEVENLGVAAVGDENVGGLDVAVDDSLAVRGFEGVGNFDGQGEQAIEFHRPALIRCFRVSPLRHSITMKRWPSCWPISWMVQMLGWFRDEAARASRRKRSRAWGSWAASSGKKFQGDEAAELGVFGFVDHTHAAATEQFEDAVMRDGLADHG